MKKRISLLASVVALSAITLMGCSNGFHTVTTAVSGKNYSGYHSGMTYTFSFSPNSNSVVVIKDENASAGSYTLSSTTLKVATSDVAMTMQYDPGNDCLYYGSDAFHKSK